jgi:hypothetical protein
MLRVQVLARQHAGVAVHALRMHNVWVWRTSRVRNVAALQQCAARAGRARFDACLVLCR